MPVNSRIDVSSSEAAIMAAIAGVGITHVMSYKMQDALRAGLLEIVLDEFEPAPWPVNILYTARRLVPLKLRTFIDWTVPRLRARLAQPAGAQTTEGDPHAAASATVVYPMPPEPTPDTSPPIKAAGTPAGS